MMDNLFLIGTVLWVFLSFLICAYITTIVITEIYKLFKK